MTGIIAGASNNRIATGVTFSDFAADRVQVQRTIYRMSVIRYGSYHNNTSYSVYSSVADVVPLPENAVRVDSDGRTLGTDGDWADPVIWTGPVSGRPNSDLLIAGNALTLNTTEATREVFTSPSRVFTGGVENGETELVYDYWNAYDAFMPNRQFSNVPEITAYQNRVALAGRTYQGNYYDPSAENYVTSIRRLYPGEEQTNTRGEHSRWLNPRLQNRYKWIAGDETEFFNAALVKWQPDPSEQITKISGAGLRNVSGVTVRGVDTAGTERFSLAATVAGSVWALDFADQSPADSDRYEITFTAASATEKSGFRQIVFGAAEVVSATAVEQVGGTMQLADYSEKNTAGTGIVAGGSYRAQLSLEYRIDAAEDVDVFRRLRARQGQATLWNLGPGEFSAFRGFLRRFSIRRGVSQSQLSLTIEGLS